MINDLNNLGRDINISYKNPLTPVNGSNKLCTEITNGWNIQSMQKKQEKKERKAKLTNK